MKTLNYNLTRQQAAKILDISTRTLDRYIKQGIFSYKKSSNRVYLDEKEVQNYKLENNDIHQSQPQSEHYGNTNALAKSGTAINPVLHEHLANFVNVLRKKDEQIEEKTRAIIMLQKRIGELEQSLNNTIALPDYTREKEKLLVDKEKLEIEKNNLLDNINKEKITNSIYLIFLIFLILFLIYAKLM